MMIDGNGFLSDKMLSLEYSDIRKVFEKANLLGKNGKSIAHLEIGRPDFDTPINIKNAAKEALDKGLVHYSSSEGVLGLREAIAEKLASENGIYVNPEDEVVITAGCKEALFNTLLAYINPGDEVLVPEPGWSMYSQVVQFLGGITVSVPLRPEREFELDPLDVAKLITPKTKMLVICSPHNPTGSVLEAGTVQRLANICIENNLLVISDEIYEKIIYDEAQHISIGSLTDMKERTITINGFSKAYAMDGWRLGYVAGHKSLIQPILKIHQYNTSCAATFPQYGAIEAYKGPQESVEKMVSEFDKRRKFLVSELNKINGILCVMPKGAFYTFPKFEGYKLSSEEMANYLLVEANVACVPGHVFGYRGEGHIRMSYSTDFESISLGVGRIKKALSKLEFNKNIIPL